jgi:hypothetical protein
MKINRGFKSFLDALLDNTPNFDGDHRYNPNKQSKILGGFQPIMDMAKDFIDTFKPYKSSSYLVRDLTQPLRGIGNTLVGIGYFFVAFIPFLGLQFDTRISWAIYGITNVLRGLSQIVTSPLAWLLKIPLRMAITYFNKEILPFEQRKSVQTLLDTALSVDDTKCANICFELHQKYVNVLAKGDITNLRSEQKQKIEKTLYGKVNMVDGNNGNCNVRLLPSKEDCQKYLSFFKDQPLQTIQHHEDKKKSAGSERSAELELHKLIEARNMNHSNIAVSKQLGIQITFDLDSHDVNTTTNFFSGLSKYPDYPRVEESRYERLVIDCSYTTPGSILKITFPYDDLSSVKEGLALSTEVFRPSVAQY